MNARTNLLALLSGGQPARVPWLWDLDYWATALVGRGLKPEGFMRSSAYIDWHLELGLGYYLQGHFPFKTIAKNCAVNEWKDGHKRYRQVETPVGTLRECWQWMPGHFTESPIEHLVTMREFRAIDSEGRTGRAGAYGMAARWMDFSGVFGEQDEKPIVAGTAIFDHPSKPRHPAPWYLSDTKDLPYFGPALLFAEPMTLKAGESFTIKYRILIHPGVGDKTALEKEYQKVAK